MLNPLKMDRRITLQRPVATQNDYGEEVITWTKVTDLWAEKRDLKGLEKWAAQQVAAEKDIRLLIRYRTDVTPVNRILFESREYDIKSVLELGRRESLEITCTARAE
jgi:SPP1 family predicted phage head-tail adaptor